MVSFYLTHRILIRCYHSRPEWTRERWQWKGTPHSSKPQHYQNIRLFSVISRTHVGGWSYPSAEKQSVYSKSPFDWANTSYWAITYSPLPMWNTENKRLLSGHSYTHTYHVSTLIIALFATHPTKKTPSYNTSKNNFYTSRWPLFPHWHSELFFQQNWTFDQ